MEKFRMRNKRLKPFKEWGEDKTPQKFSDEYAAARKLRSSDQWQRCRDIAMQLADGMCLYCYKEPAEEVHHIKKVLDFPELAFALDNLCPLGTQCHGFMGVRDRRGDDTETQIRDRMERNIGVRSLGDLEFRN